VKFANRGWWDDIPPEIRPKYSNPSYTVNVYYEPTNRSVLDVPVLEVGPWNEDDNYWDAAEGWNPRRLFKDLPLGKPEAQAAFYDGYNGGKDQSRKGSYEPGGDRLDSLWGFTIGPRLFAKWLGMGEIQ